MNAAIFASVLMAARLPSTHLVFTLMALSMQAFVLLPAQWRLLSWGFSRQQHLLATGALLLITGSLLRSVSGVLAIAYTLAVAVITAVGPALLVLLQAQRAQGPWDAAVRAHLLAAAATDPDTQHS